MIRVAILASALLALGAPGRTHAGANVLRTAGALVAADNAIDDPAEQLAGKQMEVARYHIGRSEYDAAINRLHIIATKLSTSRYVEEALARLAESYLAVGLPSEARTAVAVLLRKFPDGHWSAQARDALRVAGLEPIEDKKSWISQAFK
jgi:outer membrane protein assembly factor BamD